MLRSTLVGWSPQIRGSCLCCSPKGPCAQEVSPVNPVMGIYIYIHIYIYIQYACMRRMRRDVLRSRASGLRPENWLRGA